MVYYESLHCVSLCGGCVGVVIVLDQTAVVNSKPLCDVGVDVVKREREKRVGFVRTTAQLLPHCTTTTIPTSSDSESTMEVRSCRPRRCGRRSRRSTAANVLGVHRTTTEFVTHLAVVRVAQSLGHSTQKPSEFCPSSWSWTRCSDSTQDLPGTTVT